MTKIHVKNLVAAQEQAQNMSLKDKETVFDEIYKSQPTLLGSVLVLHNMGRSHAEMEVLLNLLLVTYLSLQDSDIKIETVSENLLERELQRNAGHVRFLDGLSVRSQDQAMQGYVESHKEKALMAYAITEMNVAGFPLIEEESAKYLMLCGINLVNCISAAKIT